MLFSAMGQEPRKGRLFPLKPMEKVVLKERYMSFVSHVPAEKAHTVSDLKKTGCTSPFRNSINRSASKHYSFDRLDAVESTSLKSYYSYWLTYSSLVAVRTEVDSAECVSPVRGPSISASIVAVHRCVLRVRYRRTLSYVAAAVYTDRLCRKSATLLWLGIEIRPPFCPLFCSFSVFVCSL